MHLTYQILDQKLHLAEVKMYERVALIIFSPGRGPWCPSSRELEATWWSTLKLQQTISWANDKHCTALVGFISSNGQMHFGIKSFDQLKSMINWWQSRNNRCRGMSSRRRREKKKKVGLNWCWVQAASHSEPNQSAPLQVLVVLTLYSDYTDEPAAMSSRRRGEKDGDELMLSTSSQLHWTKPADTGFRASKTGIARQAVVVIFWLQLDNIAKLDIFGFFSLKLLKSKNPLSLYIVDTLSCQGIWLSSLPASRFP